MHVRSCNSATKLRDDFFKRFIIIIIINSLEYPDKTWDFRQSVALSTWRLDSSHIETFLLIIQLATLEVKGRWSNHSPRNPHNTD